MAGAVNAYCGSGYNHCRIQQDGSLLYNTSSAQPSGLQYTALVVAEAVERCLPVAKIACTTGARNGTAVPCTWPPPPPPPPPPPAPPAPLVPCVKHVTLGCFGETKDHLLLRHYAGLICPNNNVSVEFCASACNSMRFTVAGIDSNHCFCGDISSLSPHSSRPMAECQVTNCSGNPAEKCGGNGRLLAYNFSCQDTQLSAAEPPLSAPAAARNDMQCGGGVDNFPFNRSIPNVLLVGDSVMFGHIGPVVKQIFDRCELAPDFCSNSTEV